MIRLQLKMKPGYTEADLQNAVNKAVRGEKIIDFKTVKRSVDARDKENVHILVTLDITVSDKAEKILLSSKKSAFSLVSEEKYSFVPTGNQKTEHRPVVVGYGPAGMFSAYMLAKYGYKPIVIERGEKIEDRKKTVESFWQTGVLNPESNVQFGEGGAGAFSDGKLSTGVKDRFGRIKLVLETFRDFGASPDICISNKPHVGTDVLEKVVRNLREATIREGAEFRFNTKVTGFKYKDGKLTGLVLNGCEVLETDICILAIGHSSRDTFEVLSEMPVLLEKKAFAIGVRMEHLQEKISKAQYGDFKDKLPAADYKMTENHEGRGVYSFCMCPGGFVVNASSEQNRTVVNGMSNEARNERNANSAIVVAVTPEDFEKEGFTDVLSGMRFQRKWEENCFKTAGGSVPVQRFTDFEKGIKTTEFGSVIPNIKGRFEKSDLSKCLPEYVRYGIISGVKAFDRKLKGFNDPDAVLSGVETRTSSPVRITRNEAYESSISGLYPCGEGAGYAGGIVSAAVDGIKVFEAIASKYKQEETK